MSKPMTQAFVSRRSRVALGALVGASLLPLTACSGSGGSAHSAGAYRSNPSPGMQTLGRRGADRANDYSVTLDTNFRALNNDWDWFWNMDRPSRLHHLPKPY